MYNKVAFSLGILYLFFSPWVRAYAEVMYNGQVQIDTSVQEPSKTVTSENALRNNQTVIRTYPQETTSYFSVSLSPTFLEYGKLHPGEPIKRDQYITIYSSMPLPFSIVASENHSLTSKSDIKIPDTSCDDGFCTENIASVWKNPLTYGFGYRCEDKKGSTCLTDFKEKFVYGSPLTNWYFLSTLNSKSCAAECYKRFANESLSQLPVRIAEGVSTYSPSTLRILTKLNISGAQQTDAYENSIEYIVIPNL